MSAAGPKKSPSDPSDLSLYDLGRELFRISDELQNELEGGPLARVPRRRPQCPACFADPIDLAPDCDPFARSEFMPPQSIAISLTCPSGHRWIEGVEWDRDGNEASHRKMEFSDGNAAEPPTESISDRNARIDNDMRNIELGRDEGPAGGCPEEES